MRALDDVTLTIASGCVHAVAGENGAGKSTLMRILGGLEQPDRGQIFFRGQPIRLRSAHDALRLGISMIHQELLPFPDMTVAENIWMGREPTRVLPGWIDRAAMNRRAAQLLERLGAPIPPTRQMNRLSVAEMQTVEIAKAIACDAGVIIMDEPTSALSEHEVEALMAIVGDLRQRGVAVIYISHKLDEIFRIADRVTVLRDGRRIVTEEIATLDDNRLIALMVGRELHFDAQQAAAAAGPVLLETRSLSRAGRFSNVSLTLRRGEILGIAGLMGAGRTELVSAIFGLEPAHDGQILMNGRPVRITSPAHAIAAGIAMVNEDRQGYGLVPRLSVKQNLTLASLGRCCRGWWIDDSAENRVAEDQIASLAIRTSGRGQEVRYLSGGNQQKVVIARALLTEPSILILDEPTRGIDIGAKSEVYAIIRRLARSGKAILMVSSELPEVMALSDRILVMREGEVTAELEPHRTSQEEILKYAMPD